MDRRPPFLPPLGLASAPRRDSGCIREGFLTAFRAPGRETLRWKLTVVWRVTFTAVDCAACVLAARARLLSVPDVDRLRARFSRDALCRESSFASCSARSRADSDAINLFLAFAEPVNILRFFGEFWLLS